jgi:hypothetical protein
MDDNSQLPLPPGPVSAKAPISKSQVRLLLSAILDSLAPMVRGDQRFSAKMLYGKRGFTEAGSKYLTAAFELYETWEEKSFNELLVHARDFAKVVQDLFPNDHARMRTILRRQVGPSMSVLYKNSIALIQFMDLGFADESFLEPINIPEQRPSPIHTKVMDERITLDVGRSLHSFIRREGVAETRQYLRQELNALHATLKASNVDRKYVEAFGKLPELIDFQDDAGAISFGLHVRLISQLTKRIEDELSDILGVQIAATLTHAGYFASQYKDWIEFLHNAQNYPSRIIVETEIDEALDNVAALLANSPETVDERIPQSIRLIGALLKGSSEDRVNAIYAGVRGIENICIATIKYAYEQAILLLQESGQKARPTVIRIGAVAIVSLTLAMISNFMPVIKNASELAWIVENLPHIEKINRILK